MENLEKWGDLRVRTNKTALVVPLLSTIWIILQKNCSVNDKKTCQHQLNIIRVR